MKLNVTNHVRVDEVGEYVGIALTNSEKPVLVYSDFNNGQIYVARSVSLTGTM